MVEKIENLTKRDRKNYFKASESYFVHFQEQGRLPTKPSSNGYAGKNAEAKR